MRKKTLYKDRIKALRNQKGITRETMAQEIGYASSTVLTWERGIAGLSLDSASDLVDYFDVSLDYLITGAFAPGQYDGVSGEVDFGARLSDVRRLEGKSIGHLMAEIGKASNTGSCYEHGNIMPSLPAMQRLAGALNVSMDYLVYGRVGGRKNDGILERS